MGPGVIELDHVSKRYPGTGAPAVTQLSLTVPRGERVVVVGPSGCGKTTTLKMINRIVAPTTGTIRVDGRDVRGRPAHELRRDLGYDRDLGAGGDQRVPRLAQHRQLRLDELTTSS